MLMFQGEKLSRRIPLLIAVFFITSFTLTTTVFLTHLLLKGQHHIGELMPPLASISFDCQQPSPEGSGLS